MTETQQAAPDLRISESTMRRMAKDLTAKYPKGPYSALTPKHYQVAHEWCGKRRRDVSVFTVRPELSENSWLRLTPETVSGYGYTDQQLYMLITDNGKEPDGSFESVLKIVKRLCNVNGPGATRRANILHMRTRRAYRNVRNTGMPGLWHVCSRHAPYGTLWRDMILWGNNRNEVEAQARLIGPMTGLDPNWSIDIEFQRWGSPDTAMTHAIDHANHRQKRLESEIASLERRLAETREALEAERLIAAKSMGGIMLLSPADENEEKEGEL